MTGNNQETDDLITRLRQWGDTSWVHQLGIGDILQQQHKLAADMREAAERLERQRTALKQKSEQIERLQLALQHGQAGSAERVSVPGAAAARRACPSHAHPSCPICNPNKTVPELNQAVPRGCTLDTDGDGNCPTHPSGCPHDESQCWEPCGELGKSEAHAVVAPEPSRGLDIVEELEARGDDLSKRAARYIRLKQRALGERDGPEQR